jgi:ornithine decarboxylase
MFKIGMNNIKEFSTGMGGKGGSVLPPLGLNNIKNFCPRAVDLFSYDNNVSSFIKYLIRNNKVTGSFRVTNLSSIENQAMLWKRQLPDVTPYYAVKCNPDPVILNVLAKMGVNFDCATQGEIHLVTEKCGVTSDRIIYANPAKMVHHLVYSKSIGVNLTVFDSKDELLKLSKIPNQKFELLLRITTDDKDSICRFSNKFGANPRDAENLLDYAKSLGLLVVGVSFHVGSGCGDPKTYTKSLANAADIFKIASKIGMPPMKIVDIGGGFPGNSIEYGGKNRPTFQEIASILRIEIIDFRKKFPDNADIKFIAEPGRFFVSDAVTVATHIYARKGDDPQSLYVDDGVYGTFNNIIYDHANPRPCKIIFDSNNEKFIHTAIFGPTCDGLDQICKADNTLLPYCGEGDWLEWNNMGAYTHTASFVFNGYTHYPDKYYCFMSS